MNAADWAYDVSIAYLAGQPYVAWTERTQTGNSQVFVKTWNGSTWTTSGLGTVNRDSNTGWAETPSLIADPNAGKLYIAWSEQQNIGQKAETYVDEYTDGSWSALGGTLNADPVNGSAERVSLAVLNGEPVAAWGEVKQGSLRNIYVKQWNGLTWSLLSQGDATAPSAVFVRSQRRWTSGWPGRSIGYQSGTWGNGLQKRRFTAQWVV